MASGPIHAFLEFLSPVLGTISFPSQWLLSHITITRTMISIINYLKETGQIGDRTCNPVLSSPFLSTNSEFGPNPSGFLKHCMKRRKCWFSAFSTLPKTITAILVTFNPSQTNPGFYVSAVQVLWKQWEEEKLLVTSNISFSHSVFLPFGELSTIFIEFEIVVCKPFQFGRLLNLLFGKGLNCQLQLWNRTCIQFCWVTTG